MVIVRLHVNFPGCISLSHLRRTLCQDSPWKTATKTKHHLFDIPAVQASFQNGQSFIPGQLNTTYLTILQLSLFFNLSMLRLSCQVLKYLWSEAHPKAPSMKIDHLKKLQLVSPNLIDHYQLPTKMHLQQKQPPPVTLPPPYCSQQISPVQIPPQQFQRFLPVPHHGWLVDQWHGAGSPARMFGNPWLEEIATKKKPFCWSCKSFTVLKVEVWCTTKKCGTGRSASYFTSSSSNGGSFWEWILVLNYLCVLTSRGVLL